MSRTDAAVARRPWATRGQDRSGDRKPLLVPGTVLVAFLVACTRWGSYLGVPAKNLYVTDLLLVASIGWTLVRFRHLMWPALRHGWRGLAPILALTGWVLLRFAAGPLSGDAVRDVAPYAYLFLVASLAAIAVPAAALRRSGQVLFAALVAHLCWVTVTAVLGDPFVRKLPALGSVIYVFELRPDVDGALLAVLAGTAFYAALAPTSDRGLGRTALLIGLGLWASGVVFLLTNRAAVIALLAAYLVTTVTLAPQLRQVWRRWRGWVVAVVAVGLVAVAVLAPRTPTYQRLMGTGTFTQGTTVGTTAARHAAWSSVLRYADATPARAAVGVGTGPDFLKASGASVHYQAVGRKTVRAPHNFVLNTYARFGLVGVVLLAWLLAALGVRSVRLLRSARRGAAELGWVLTLTTLFVTSLVGVILESPFGAIPFAWAAGRVLLWRPQAAPLADTR